MKLYTVIIENAIYAKKFTIVNNNAEIYFLNLFNPVQFLDTK